MSLMSSLYVGVSGLNVSQSGLNTTAHNLTNADTEGYVRQMVLATDTKYVTVGHDGNGPMQVGYGTTVGVIRQLRNQFYDALYRTEYGRQGFYETQYKTSDEVEELFSELENEPYQKKITTFWESLQELAKYPDDIAIRESFISTAVGFTERSEKMAKQLEEYQESLNLEVTKKVNQINQLGAEISELNRLISKYESGKVEEANDYRDARNLCIDRLSQLIKVDVTESPDGVVKIMAEGNMFVGEQGYSKMSLRKGDKDIDIKIPVWEDTGRDVFNLQNPCKASNNTDIGSLKGLVVSRGYKTANYTDIPLKTASMSPQQWEAAVEEYNRTVDPSIVMRTQAEFDQLFHGIVTTINDLLCPNKDVTILNSDGTTSIIKVFDEDNAPQGMDEKHTKGEELFKRKSTQRYQNEQEVEVVIGTDPTTGNPITEKQKVRIYNEEDPKDLYSLYTLGQVEINPEILNNWSKLPLSPNNSDVAYDAKLVNDLQDAWNAKTLTLNPNTLTKDSFADYYTSLMGDIGTEGEKLRTLCETQTETAQFRDNKRQEAMGVSTDEELTNMIKFQHAYNANVRYINAVDQMLEHLIMRLG